MFCLNVSHCFCNSYCITFNNSLLSTFLVVACKNKTKQNINLWEWFIGEVGALYGVENPWAQYMESTGSLTRTLSQYESG